MTDSFPDWGTVPGYIGGLALLLTVITIRNDRIEKRREQANKVAAWPLRDESGAWKIAMRNASDLPVTNPSVGYNAGRRPGRLLLSKAGPGADIKRKPQYRRLIPPNETIYVDVRFDVDEVLVTWFEFVDAAGRRWIRTNGGLRVRQVTAWTVWWRKMQRQGRLARRVTYRRFERAGRWLHLRRDDDWPAPSSAELDWEDDRGSQQDTRRQGNGEVRPEQA
jgi:hypothetical protein